jgi:hypothetical protein
MEGVAKRLVGGKGKILLCLFGNRSEICKQIIYAKQLDYIAFYSVNSTEHSSLNSGIWSFHQYFPFPH